MLQKFLSLLKPHWGKVLLAGILLAIIILNFKPGFYILGNDNFSPELNPGLTLQRSLFAPAWRTYRALGLPSDSEQSDIFRTLLYTITNTFLPGWLISQGYLLATFFIASWSMASLTRILTKKIIPERYSQLTFLLGGLFYTSTMLTSWIYFYPLHLFVAAYAFLPFVLWRLSTFMEKPSAKNGALLLIAALLLSTAALTATMYIICAAVIGAFILFFFLRILLAHKQTQNNTTHSRKHLLQHLTTLPKKQIGILIIACFLIFGSQEYWMFPFLTYVKTNTTALRNSAINREITAETIENEARFNTWLNSIRFYASWMDTKEDNTHYTFTYRNWYTSSVSATILSLIPILMAIIGSLYIIKKRHYLYAIFILMLAGGWYLIKGINPPLGSVYGYIQNNYPVLAQIFRWQSSKLWPLIAISLPILGTLGSIALFQKLLLKSLHVQPHVHHNMKGMYLIRKRLPECFIAIIIIGLIAFIYPYFNGDLIRPKVYTKVPQEYFALATYLQQHDPHSRIYPTPETNTLYFRNYSWGFWGSVLLNYLLPNPIMEKALVIGSSESEQAYQVLQNAYFSEKPDRFINTLRRYNVSFILSDEYVVKGDVGYAYKTGLNDLMVTNNPDLVRIWQQGKLSLYKIRETNYPNQAFAVAPQTDFTRLNMILTMINDTSPYYSAPHIHGAIIPLAADFDDTLVNDSEIIGEYHSTSPSDTYRLTIPDDLMNQAPMQMKYLPDQHIISIEPSLPFYTINDKPYLYTLPAYQYKVDKTPSYIAINDTVVDLSQRHGIPAAVNIPFGTTPQASISAYTDNSHLIDITGTFNCSGTTTTQFTMEKRGKMTCSSTPLNLINPTVARISLQLKNDGPLTINLCVWSAKNNACLNTSTFANVAGNSNVKTSFIIPVLYPKNDTAQLIMTFTNQQNDIVTTSLDQVMFEAFQDTSKIQKAETKSSSNLQNLDIPIHSGDKVDLHIPRLTGPDTWVLAPDSFFKPELHANPFDATKEYESSITTIDSTLQFVNKESNASLRAPFQIHTPGSMAMIIVHAANNLGVPMQLSLQEAGEDRPLWKRQLFVKSTTHAFDIVPLPQTGTNMQLQAFTTGLGPRKSINILNQLLFQTMSPSWYQLRLQPLNAAPLYPIFQLKTLQPIDTNSFSGQTFTNAITTIPTAVSPYWFMEGLRDEKVTVNGWQQGWISGKSASIKIWYWPNLLVYVGYGLIGILVVLLGYIAFHEHKTSRHQTT